MKTLYAEVSCYIELRQAMGYKLRGAKRTLERFVAFLRDAGARSISTSLALKWASDPALSVRTRMLRLSLVRGFARYLRGIDQRSEVPPLGALRLRYSRPKPYVYSEVELRQIVKKAFVAADSDGYRNHRYHRLPGTHPVA